MVLVVTVLTVVVGVVTVLTVVVGVVTVLTVVVLVVTVFTIVVTVVTICSVVGALALAVAGSSNLIEFFTSWCFLLTVRGFEVFVGVRADHSAEVFIGHLVVFESSVELSVWVLPDAEGGCESNDSNSCNSLHLCVVFGLLFVN